MKLTRRDLFKTLASAIGAAIVAPMLLKEAPVGEVFVSFPRTYRIDTWYGWEEIPEYFHYNYNGLAVKDRDALR